MIWYGAEDRNENAHIYKFTPEQNKLIEIKNPLTGKAALRFIIPLSNNYCLLAMADINTYYHGPGQSGKLLHV